MIKLLYINPEPDRSERAILRGLKSRGVSVRAIMGTPTLNTFSDELKGLDIVEHNFKGKLSRLSIKLIKSQINEFQPNIIYFLTNQAITNGLIAARGSNAKLIAYRGIGANFGVFNPIAWMRYLNPRINRIVCVSESIRTSLANINKFGLGLKPEKLITIYKGHDLSWYEGIKPKEGHPLSKDKVRFICAANWRPRKGLDVLFQAIQLLPEALPIEFIVVGSGTDQETFKSMARSTSYKASIHFIGFSREVLAWMAASDVSILPSIKREGLPRSVIESMAMGKPQIVTNVGGSPELVRHLKEGMVIPPSDPSALAEAIMSMTHKHKERSEMGNSARQRIRDSFNIQKTIDEIYNLYISVLKNQNKLSK